MNSTDDDLAELLTLNRAVDTMCIIRYRNSAGQLHRIWGPAVIYPSGSKFWFQNGLHHRSDGPAVIYPDGSEWWYQRGQIHREDGPAAIYPDGEVCWYLVGVQITKDQCCNDWNV